MRKGPKVEMLSRSEWEKINNKHSFDRAGENPFSKWLIRFHCTLPLKARSLVQNYMFQSTVSKKFCLEKQKQRHLSQMWSGRLFI